MLIRVVVDKRPRPFVMLMYASRVGFWARWNVCCDIIDAETGEVLASPHGRTK